MKTNKIELDVDFIGGQDSLTFAEAKTLSDYFSKTKVKSNKSQTKLSARKAKRSKISA